MLTAWPNGRDLNDGYIGALAAVLCDYPRSVALKCADPLKGVARETKFLPTVADLVAWCERRVSEMKPASDRRDYYEEQMAGRRRDDDIAYERLSRPALAELRELYGPNWGIGQGDESKRARELADEKHLEAVRRGNDRAYASMEGGTVSAGIPITRALLDSLKERAKE